MATAALASLWLPIVPGLTGCAGHVPVPLEVEDVRLDPHAAPQQTAGPDSGKSPEHSSPQGEPESPTGVFHRVLPGQTLWRIAKVYGIALGVLLEVNGIEDPEKIGAGQQVFIPGAGQVLDVPPYPAPLPQVATPASPEAEVADRGTDVFEWPVSGGEILSRFGARRRTHRHRGLDIRGAPGQEVIAVAAGTVTFSGNTRTGYGRLVIVDHGGGIESLYAHNQDMLVQPGDAVSRGQPIALVGKTGNATTHHCHFEIRRGGVPVDPLPFFLSVAEVRP